MAERVRLAIFDLDGTLLEGNVWLAFIRFFRGTKRRRLRLTFFLIYHLLPFPFFRIGLFPKERYFIMWGKNLSWLLKGLQKNRAEELFDEIARDLLFPYLRKELVNEIEKHREEGRIPVIDSGTFSPLLKRIARHVGAENAFGTELEVRNGRLTGRIKGTFNIKEEKVQKIERQFKREGKEIDWKGSFAYADSIFDLPLLLKVGNPIVVFPDEDLMTHAREKGWKIFGEDRKEEHS